MSHSLPPKPERSSVAPDLPEVLSHALEKVRGDTANLEAWEELIEVCRDEDRPDEAAALFTETLDSEIDGQTLEDVGRLAADFCEEWYEDTAPVLEMLGAVLAKDAQQDWAFERLTVLLTVSAKWDELLLVYDNALTSAEAPSRKQALLEEAAKVARDFAGKPERASDYLKELLLLRLSDEQLASTLERRLDDQGRHEDLIEIWTARLPVVSKEAAIKTRLQIAARHLDALSDGESAFLALGDFLEAGGPKSQACEIYERLADSSVASTDVRRSALTELDRLYSEAGKWGEVVRATERHLALAESVSDKIALHGRIAELLAQQQDLSGALVHSAAILKLDPSSDAARKQARELAQKTGQMSDYVAALVAASKVAKEGERRVSLLIEAAQSSRVDLGQAEAATDLYFLVGQDPDADSAARLLACQELSELLKEAGRSSDLLSVLEKRADLETKGDERRRILGEAAELSTQLGQGERALGLWSLRLNDDPKDVVALSAKIDIFAELSKYQGLVEALIARAKVGTDREQQRMDLVRGAAVYAERLNDLANGIAVWEAIEDSFGREPETFDALIELNAKAGAHEKVVELLEVGIEEEEDAVRAVQQLGRLGDVQRLYLQDSEAALAAYEKALLRDPSSDVARAGLSALLLDAKHAHAAGEALCAAYRASADPASIIGLVEIRLRAAPSDDFRSVILLEAAELYEREGDGHGALNALVRAFALVPESSTEAEMHRLAEVTSNWAAAADGYTKAITALESAKDSNSLVGKLFLSKGRVEEERLGRPDLATASYHEALSRDPAKLNVANALVRVAHLAGMFGEAAWGVVEPSRKLEAVSEEQLTHFAECAAAHGNWEGALEGLADKIASADGLVPVVAHDLKKQLAVWYRDMLGDPDSAEMVLKRATQDFPQEDSLRVLADLQRRIKGRPLVLTLVALADVCPKDLAILREAGDVALQDPASKELAQTILERALKVSSAQFEKAGGVDTEAGFDASDVCAWATDHLVALALGEKRPEAAVELLENSAALPFESGEQVGRKFRAAEVAAQVGLDERAVELCQSVLEREPKHEGAITLLSGLHEKAGRLDELLVLRAQELALDRPQERRLFLRLDQARVLGETGAKPKKRIAVLQDNLVDLPGHADTVSALSRLLEDEEQFEALVSMLEVQAREIVATEPGRAAVMWARAGQLASEHLQDDARLETNFKHSAAAAPSASVLDRLAIIAHAAEAFEAEVSWLGQLLQLLPEASEGGEAAQVRRAVVVRLGDALVRTDDRASARTTLEEELRKDPPANEARLLLAKIYRETEEWARLSALQTAGVQYAPDDETKIAYLRSAALVERRRLGDLEAAIPLLSQAIDIDGEDRTLKLLLADTLREAEHYSAAAEILSALLEEFGRRRTKERAIVHLQLARIARAAGDLDEALEQAEAAAKIERTDAEILMLVGQLAREKGQLDRAEQAYRTLALIASRATPTEADEDADGVGESAILFELYRIAEEKGDTDQARELLDSALEVATRDANEALRLATALKASGQIELLLSALEAQLSSGLQGAVAARMLVTKANVLERSDRPEEALSARLQAMTYTPDNGLLIDATDKLAERCGLNERFWSHIVTLANANASNPAVAGDLWYRAGRGVETAQGDLKRAAEYYELSQATGHRPRRAFRALDRVLDERAEPARVKKSLERYVKADGAEGSPDVYADALYRLAEFEFAAGEVDSATSHLMLALETEAQEERALAMLEPIARSGNATDRVVILFLRVCRKAASPETLLFAFRKAVSVQTVESSVLSEAIEQARSLDDGEALRELLSRAIAVADDKEELEAARGLIVERASLARSDADYAQELLLLGKAAPLFEGEDRFELELRQAVCLTEHLGRVADGTAILERLLSDNEKEGRVWRPLLSIYRNAGRIDDVELLIAVVEEHATDDADLDALKMERIRLMVSADRLEEAEVQLRETLEERPHLSEAAAILADLLRKAERWEELKELALALFNQARSRADVSQVVRFGLELAQLVMDEDREEAINVLTSGLEVAKGNREYVSFLLSLYTDEDNQSERADVMEHLLALAQGESAREQTIALYSLRQELGDDYGAGRALEIGVKAAPNVPELVQMYIDHLRSAEDFPRLAETLMVQALQAKKGEAAADLFAEAARIYDENLGDPTSAAKAAARAYEADPTNVAHLEKGAQYLVAVGQVDEALSQLKVAIETGDDMALADLLELRSNIIRKERALDRTYMAEAARDLARALEQLIPEEQEDSIQRAIIEVLTDLRGLCQSDRDEAGERAVVLELSDMHLQLGDSAAGIDTLASWVRDHESDKEVVLRLGKIATGQGDHSAAVFAYQKLFEMAEGSERTEAVLLLADAAALAGDPMDAKLALEDAFAADPGNRELLLKLKHMYQTAGAYQDLAVILLSEAEKTEDVATRCQLYLEAGDMYLQADEAEVAIGVFEQALEIAESPFVITSKLADCYLAVGDATRAEEVLNDAVNKHGKRRTPELAILQQGLARVAEAAGNEEGMFAWLEAALMSDRNNGDVARELAVRGQERERYDIAIKALQSITLSKVDIAMSKGEAYFRQAQIAQIQGDPKKALLMARRAHAGEPDLPGLERLIAELGG